jgi:hypothetical protein
MRNWGRGLTVAISFLLSAGLAHCSSDDTGGGGNTTPDPDAAGGSDAPPGGGDGSTADTSVPGNDGGVDAADAAPSTPFAVAGFDTFTTFGANYLTCDPVGNCYGNKTNIYKLAPNATAYTNIGDSSKGFVSAFPSSILLDGAGNLYTNAGCGGSLGVYKLPAGGTTWAKVGTGLTDPNPTSCNFNTMAADSAGTIYVGFAIDPKELWKLPAGQTAWVNTGAGLNGTVRATVTIGNDVYVTASSGVKKLASGATTWADYGDQNNLPILPYRLHADPAGNLYETTEQTVYKLAAGATAATTWQSTTGISTGSTSSNPVFDSAGNAYIAADNGAASKIALYKLAAGTLAWVKLFDTNVFSSENCRAMADDHIGHLILQCNSMMLRSK